MSTAISVRIDTANKAKATGQRKHDLRLYDKDDKNFPNYIDSERSHLNSVLIEPPLSHALSEEIAEARKANGQQRLRKDACIAITGIISLGHEAQKIIEAMPPSGQDGMFKSVAERLAIESGHPLIGLVVHRDESAIHAHFILRGFAKDENGFEKPWRKERWFGAKLQDWAADEVAHLGITRGKPKCLRSSEGEPDSKWVHRSVKRLHQDLPNEIAEMEKRSVAAAEKAHKNKRLAEAAEEKGKEVAETYRKRQKQAEEEHRKILDEIQKMRETLLGLEKNAKAATEAKEAAERDAKAAIEAKEEAERNENAAKARIESNSEFYIDRARRRVEDAKLPIIKPEVEIVKNLFGLAKVERKIVPFEKFSEYEEARRLREENAVALVAKTEAVMKELKESNQKLERTLELVKTQFSKFMNEAMNRAASGNSEVSIWSEWIKSDPVDNALSYFSKQETKRKFEEGDTRYGVALKIFPGRVVVATQGEKVTSKQIAAALYRVTKERAQDEKWRGIIFTVSDEIMAQKIHDMARQDGIKVEIQFTDGEPFFPPQRRLVANDERDAAPARRLG